MIEASAPIGSAAAAHILLGFALSALGMTTFAGALLAREGTTAGRHVNDVFIVLLLCGCEHVRRYGPGQARCIVGRLGLPSSAAMVPGLPHRAGGRAGGISKTFIFVLNLIRNTAYEYWFTCDRL